MSPNETPATSGTPVPSQSEIADIIAASGDPSLRNLRITLCYSKLSLALAERFGRGNVNWCTFATWASKTAGRFIRLANLDEHVKAALRQCFGPIGWAESVRAEMRNSPFGFDIGDELIIEAARNIASEVSAEVAAGNLTVFAELAPMFSLLAELSAVGEGHQDAVKHIVDTLRTGPTGQDGQDLLRQAVADYGLSMLEADPRLQAEVMLRANAQVGAHEQIRLQSYIQKAMTAPLSEAVAVLLRRKSRMLSRSAADRGRLDALLVALFRPYRAQLDQVWLQVSTRYLMTLELPNGTLHLGRDLPNLPGQPIFPAHLSNLQDPELLRILRIYRADGISARGSGASEWSNLSDRMRYILELFRSRQQDTCLLDPPFDVASTQSIRRGTVPLLGT